MNDIPLSETAPLFASWRGVVDPDAAAAIERAVDEASDRELCRINPISFASRHGLGEEAVIAAFLHAAHFGLFELSWNVVCPGCGGVLGHGETLKTVHHEDYLCALCSGAYQCALDDMVEVTFTVSRRVRRIAGHDPDSLPYTEYLRQIFFASALDLPEDLQHEIDAITLDSIELPAREKAQVSVQAPAELLIVFEPVSHTAQFIDVKGEPTRERQSLSVQFNHVRTLPTTVELSPGPLRLSLENRTDARVLPGIWVANHSLHDLLGRRRPFLAAKRLLSNQVFRDLYGTDTLDPEQRLKITSLTFLFTDLKGSTALYERVGDLAAYDLVKAHSQVLYDIVAAERGAVVKTIGDAVMATFTTPDRAVAAALRMREAMARLNAERGGDDLLLKIGIHEGPCLAVVLNDHQDYFGSTVNIAARVQGLAEGRAIFASEPVVRDERAASLLAEKGLTPQAQQRALRGLANEYAVFEIP